MSNLADYIPKGALFIINTIKSNGFDCYLVGGSVRDSLIGYIVNDYDITTNARPEDIERMFKKTYGVGKSFGTIIVVVDDNEFEVTTYRSEHYDRISRKPEVEYSDNIIEDLSRRDFTINAIAYDPINNTFVDPFKGEEDINNRIIKTPGCPERTFLDDPLRILRMIRFASKFKDYNFGIEYNTYNSALKLIKEIDRISNERKRNELEEILKYNFKNYSSILSMIFNYLNFDKKVKWMDYFIVKIAYMLNEDVDLEFVKKELVLTNEEFNILKMIFTFKDTVYNSLEEFKETLSVVGFENIKYLMNYYEYKHSEPYMIDLKLYLALSGDHPIFVSDLKINGNDLIKLGYSGKDIGIKLVECLRIVLKDPFLNNKEFLLNYCKKEQ